MPAISDISTHYRGAWPAPTSYVSAGSDRNRKGNDHL